MPKDHGCGVVLLLWKYLADVLFARANEQLAEEEVCGVNNKSRRNQEPMEARPFPTTIQCSTEVERFLRRQLCEAKMLQGRPRERPAQKRRMVAGENTLVRGI